MKVLRGGTLSSPGERARFRTEARASARLRHANIVTVLAVGESLDLPFYAMEYLPAGSLAHRLDGTPLGPAEAATLLEVVATAIEHAHQNQVIHRDLKPANILLDGPPPGWGRRCRRWRTSASPSTSTTRPTPRRHRPSSARPRYMAPEQAVGRSRDVGPAADVYALGAILYECLTGRPPFQGGLAYETLVQVREAEPVPPRRLRPGSRATWRRSA